MSFHFEDDDPQWKDVESLSRKASDHEQKADQGQPADIQQTALPAEQILAQSSAQVAHITTSPQDNHPKIRKVIPNPLFSPEPPLLSAESPVESLVVKIESTDIADTFRPVQSPREVSFDHSNGTFQYFVNIMDPIQIGDKLSGHVEYRIVTKTNDPSFNSQDFSVSRRYSDFVWMYSHLVNKFPGIVVPPVPEKMAIGRFNEDFIQSRKNALETFCQKLLRHPYLQTDADVRIFLESADFAAEKKKNQLSNSIIAGEILPYVNVPFCKIPDEDEVLVGKKLYFEDLDIKLKNIHKVVDSLIRERKDLGEYCKELAEKFNELALLEKNEALSKKLEKISKIHSILKDAHDAQVNNELKHIAGVLEEYIRTIGSVKVAYAIRLKVHTNNNNLDVIYQKKLETITRLEQSSKVRVDKISAAKSEYLETSKAMESSSTDFQQITHRLIKDIDRIEQMKLEDFAQSTKRYLSLMIESQQKIVTAWQSYSQ